MYNYGRNVNPNKKQKEKIMLGNTKTRILIISIILLVILCLVTGYYAFTLREKYNITNTINYTIAFNNLVNYVNNVEN